MSDKLAIDIQALAALARLQISEEEKNRLAAQLPAILDLVAAVQNVVSDVPMPEPEIRNVMREDGAPYEPGLFTEKLLAGAPNREGNRIAVKQVLSKQK